MTSQYLLEAHLQGRVIDLARLRGWRCAHVRPARTQRGRCTPYKGDPGLPDLILARGGAVVLAEIKTATGRLTPEQLAWLDAAGQHGTVWRPADWETITETLGATHG